jgi:hypothetical protein
MTPCEDLCGAIVSEDPLSTSRRVFVMMPATMTVPSRRPYHPHDENFVESNCYRSHDTLPCTSPVNRSAVSRCGKYGASDLMKQSRRNLQSFYGAYFCDRKIKLHIFHQILFYDNYYLNCGIINCVYVDNVKWERRYFFPAFTLTIKLACKLTRNYKRWVTS